MWLGDYIASKFRDRSSASLWFWELYNLHWISAAISLYLHIINFTVTHIRQKRLQLKHTEIGCNHFHVFFESSVDNIYNQDFMA